MFPAVASRTLGQLDPGKYPSSRHSEQVLEAEWRFRGCVELRHTLLEVAEWAGATSRAVDRFRRCGTNAGVWRSASTGTLRVIAEHCRNRWCPRCRSYVQARTRRRLEKWLATANRDALKFVTLTLKPSSRPLCEQLAHLWRSFRRLRSSRFWRALSARGLCVAETTRGADGRHWHVHLHAIMESPYVDARKLSAAWRTASSGSFIVKVKQVRRDQPTESLSQYLSSYMAKEPPGVDATDAKLVAEWVRALTAQHWVVSFGKRRPIPEQQKTEAETDPGPWEYVAPLSTLILAARGGHEVAAELLRRLESAREVSSVELRTHGPPGATHNDH